MNSPNETKKWKLKDEVVYGPFATRRKGMSLGINVLAMGEKFCSFDCLYCQCGFTRGFDPATTPRESYLDLGDLRQALEERFVEVASGAGADTIVLSGNGEPTLHPQFDGVVEILLEARTRYLPALEVQCLSAGSELHRKEVVRGLNLLDRPILKLDAATPELLRRVDRPLVDFDLERFVGQTAALDRFWLQTCFFTGAVSNVAVEALEAWYTLVARLRPAGVEIYSLDREPPAKRLEAVPFELLQQIAAELRIRHGIDSLVV